jgi:hypothetical protein
VATYPRNGCEESTHGAATARPHRARGAPDRLAGGRPFAPAFALSAPLEDPDFRDGTAISIASFNLAAAREPLPFDSFKGGDTSRNFSASWTFRYEPFGYDRRIMIDRISSAACLLVTAALAVPLSACATRTIDDKVIDRDGIQVFLRHRREQGEEVERGFAHPARISSQRLARILSSVEVQDSLRKGLLRKKVTTRRAAFEEGRVGPLAEALSETFGQANSTHEIVLLSVRTERRYVVFARRFVTSFIAFIEGDALYLDLSRLRWEIPKDQEDERLPMPKRGDRVMSFRALPGPAARSAGPQLLAISWRDPVFEGLEAAQLEIASEPPEPAETPEKPRPELEHSSASELPSNLSGATLRELADLEKAREQGEISESYYRRRREKLLRPAAERDALH